MFDTVLSHNELFGISARWNYFESGHGKGPCNGIGGSSKRQAADAVKQGKVSVQDAHEFYQWAKGNDKSIEYVFYTEEEYNEMEEQLKESKIKSVTGTMKVHAVCGEDCHLYTREESCYCLNCYKTVYPRRRRLYWLDKASDEIYCYQLRKHYACK